MVYLKLWNNLCIWQLQSNHCRYQAMLCSIKLQTLQKKINKTKTPFSNMLIWKAVINRTANILLFLWLWGGRCAHTLTLFPSFLHRWNKYSRNLPNNTEKDGLHNTVNHCCYSMCVAVAANDLVWMLSEIKPYSYVIYRSISAVHLRRTKLRGEEKSPRPWTQEWQCTMNIYGTYLNCKINMLFSHANIHFL